MDANKERNTKHADRNIKLSNIFATLKFVFLAEHLAGIYRFSFRDGQIIATNWVKKTYALCLIICYGGFYLFHLLPLIIYGKISPVAVIDELPIIIVLTLYVMTVTTTNTYFRKANEEFFVTVADLDSKLISPSNDEFYVKARAKNYRFIFILVASHIGAFVADIATEGEVLTLVILIVMPLYLSQTIEIGVFCLAIDMLKTRLDVINGFIAKFLDEKQGYRVYSIYGNNEVVNDTFNMIGSPSENNTKIRDLSNMYDTIGSLCSLVNSIFNFQIFMTLVSTFTYILIAIWTSLYYYRSTAENNTGPLVAVVVWCFTTLMIVTVTCLVCESLRLSRNNTKVLVNEIIMDYDLPKKMRAQAKSFMELIEARPLSILIYDMFSVDITLVLKFISVSTTYLIVIIQVTHFT